MYVRENRGLSDIFWQFLSGQLAAGRTQELKSELLAAGIPL